MSRAKGESNPSPLVSGGSIFLLHLGEDKGVIGEAKSLDEHHHHHRYLQVAGVYTELGHPFRNDLRRAWGRGFALPVYGSCPPRLAKQAVSSSVREGGGVFCQILLTAGRITGSMLRKSSAEASRLDRKMYPTP